MAWPWKRDADGRLVDAFGNPISADLPYLERTLPMLPELDALARAVQAAKTAGDLRRLRAWVDAVVKRLDEGRAITPFGGPEVPPAKAT